MHMELKLPVLRGGKVLFYVRFYDQVRNFLKSHFELGALVLLISSVIGQCSLLSSVARKMASLPQPEEVSHATKNIVPRNPYLVRIRNTFVKLSKPFS